MFFKVSAVLALCLVAVYAATSSVDPKDIPIVAQETIIEPDGSYRYNYETGNGVKASQVGELKQIEKETVGISQGSYSWQDEDGKTYTVTYVADENGFQPTGEHLPVPPEIPAAIQKSLAYLATAPPPKE